KSFNWIKRKVPKSVGKKVLGLGMKGIFVKPEYKRLYPSSPLAAHLLGFTGTDNRGLEGVEYSLNKVLYPDNHGNPDRAIVFGNNVHLTLNSDMQEACDFTLKQGVIEYQAEGGSIVIVDSKSGEILSMTNYPRYNNNQFSSHRASDFRNRAISDYYEPGSIFKLITAAILIEEGLVTGQEKFLCTGHISVNNREIKCTGNHGWVTLSKALKKSCNAAIVQASLRIDKQLFYDYLNRFEFGKKPGVELSGETGGLLRPYDELTQLSKGRISFGYEIAVSPLQLAMAASVIANGGYLLKPTIVKSLTNTNGQVIRRHNIKAKRQILSTQTSDSLLRILENVMDDGGTGSRGRIRGLRIAGKTSTVKLYNKRKRIYEDDKVHTAFLGIIPQAGRNLVILVLIRKPKTSYISSHVAVPVFKKLVDRLLDRGVIY
ncbi:MAG: penicillin-binding protein 2, partial [Spirochaetota bacterium]|nr:penicillin-binding protein 2 [Spirochaetota bacterium]